MPHAPKAPKASFSALFLRAVATIGGKVWGKPRHPCGPFGGFWGMGQESLATSVLLTVRVGGRLGRQLEHSPRPAAR
jgi:hypothetical protein